MGADTTSLLLALALGAAAAAVWAVLGQGGGGWDVRFWLGAAVLAGLLYWAVPQFP